MPRYLPLVPSDCDPKVTPPGMSMSMKHEHEHDDEYFPASRAQERRRLDEPRNQLPRRRPRIVGKRKVKRQGHMPASTWDEKEASARPRLLGCLLDLHDGKMGRGLGGGDREGQSTVSRVPLRHFEGSPRFIKFEIWTSPKSESSSR